MNKAILFKEWIKTRWVLLLLFILFALAVGYITLRLSSAIRNVGIAHIWEVFIMKNVVMLSQLKYLPFLGGTCIAMAQFVPEMVRSRLKLTLHLPLRENRVIALMLSYGFTATLLLTALPYAIFLLGFSVHFPREITIAWTVTLLPHLLGGCAVYLLTAWIVLEPDWHRRIGSLVISGLLLSLFLIEEAPGAYGYMFPFLIICLFALFFLPKASIRHFKAGK